MVVDDDPNIRQMLHDILGSEYRVIVASDGEEGLERLAKDAHEIAVVIADQMMPGLTGVQMLRKIADEHPEIVRILVTASDRLADARDAINVARVDRFLSKPVRMIELRAIVSGALRERRLLQENRALVQDLEEKNRMLHDALEAVRFHEHNLTQKLEERTRELKGAMKELAALAVRDGLTGLYNHRFFQESFTAEVARARRHDRSVSLLFIDVDNFKNYNDSAGHPAGDELLRTLAKIIATTSRREDFSARGGRELGAEADPASERRLEGPGGRESDIVARYGGEEFVVMLPETPKAGAQVRAERLRSYVEAHPFSQRERQPGGRVTISVGVATFPEDGGSREQILEAADKALLKAKQTGKNRVVVA
ncbi:MAG: diguanylate cyclase [Deltaproteobacteria bacterium]|nr:diguanylate cyclase [Deltaproteobacteria bacterium]